MNFESFEGQRSKFCEIMSCLSAASCYNLQSLPAQRKPVVNATMELQAISGLHQGFCNFLSLGSTQRTRRVSSSGLAPLLRNSSVSGGSFVGRNGRGVMVVSCSGGEGSGEAEVKKVVLKKGSAVVVTEAPPLLKTAEPMPMLRPNNGLISVGDAGRILDRRPKDTWAVRFAVGAYLIDRKYFEPLEL